jgi:hypothetical protein
LEKEGKKGESKDKVIRTLDIPDTAVFDRFLEVTGLREEQRPRDVFNLLRQVKEEGGNEIQAGIQLNHTFRFTKDRAKEIVESTWDILER